MLNDSQLIDHLSAGVPFYLEMDEPDGMIQCVDAGVYTVKRRRRGTVRTYDEIARVSTLREALDAAINVHGIEPIHPDADPVEIAP